eukprot:5189497-Amphidinium_carterae.1
MAPACCRDWRGGNRGSDGGSRHTLFSAYNYNLMEALVKFQVEICTGYWYMSHNMCSKQRAQP